ncbi:hypothetical protein MMC16_007375 [Acarospora aff. strigata]|nr:hypothetical protein [Acarospora aff. strigata]
MSETQNTTPRRVLGALAVNTPTTASKPEKPLFTPIKPIHLPPLSHPLSPPRAGQKRGIDQVEESPRPSTARRKSPAYSQPRKTSIVVYEDVQTALQPAECSAPGSIVANTPSRLTRTPVPDSSGTASQSSLKDSMSSLIDFDLDDESASSTQTAPTEPPTPGQATARLRAETLRLRLRVAMFKINTHQTNIPLSQLQISPKKMAHSPPQYQQSPAQDVGTPWRTQAQHAISKLLPAPVLVPTAYSARQAYDASISSSPSSSVNSSQERPTPDLTTPVLPKQRPSHPPMQLDSPSGSQEKRSQGAKASDSEVNLPSSVVKDRAATGLLKLMNID